jgi:hypothetical protein
MYKLQFIFKFILNLTSMEKYGVITRCIKNYSKLCSVFALMIFIILVAGCDKDDELVAITSIVTTEPILTANGYESGGRMTGNREIEITGYGVSYSTSENPAIEDAVATGSEMNASWEQSQYVVEFTSRLPLLAPGTRYYLRAYITTRSGTAYGNQLEFTTNP